MPEPPEDPREARRAVIVRALRRHRARLARKLEALRGDLAEAERGPQYRRYGEALLAYIAQVPARAAHVRLPDPADPAGALEIELDPAVKPQVNAARYFKRAAKAERGIAEVPPRLAAVEADLHALTQLLERVEHYEERGPTEDGGSVVALELDGGLDADLYEAVSGLPPNMRAEVARALAAGGVAIGRGAGGVRRGREAGGDAVGSSAGAGAGGGARGAKVNAATVASGETRAPSARLQPRRMKSAEGWDVLIGRNNEGNDYLTHQLARSEDYWFHVHGAAGSHVVLRRGKGKNEPSKATIEEVASWAAFYSQARSAGRVPVIVTQKKYVRKPRKAPPGLAICEREKIVMVRPKEPERSAEADEARE